MARQTIVEHKARVNRCPLSPDLVCSFGPYSSAVNRIDIYSSMLKAVFFDFDGTLCDDGATIDHALEEASRAVCECRPDIGRAALGSAYREISERAWTDYDRYLRPLVSPEAMLASLWEQTLALFGCHDTIMAHTAATTYWRHRLNNCRPFPDVLPFLSDVCQSFHTSLLTNGAPSMQRAKVKASGLDTYFNDVFVGGEFEQGKPAPFIFSAALNAAGCRPDQAVHIGDSLLHDVGGARRSGLHSVWLNRRRLQRDALRAAYSRNVSAVATPTDCRMSFFEYTELARPDFEIVSLDGLPACLERIAALDCARNEAPVE